MDNENRLELLKTYYRDMQEFTRLQMKSKELPMPEMGYLNGLNTAIKILEGLHNGQAPSMNKDQIEININYEEGDQINIFP